MKICFLGNFQVDYTSETHHLKSLEALGHQVFPLQEGTALSEDILQVAVECDLFVWVHTHGLVTGGIEHILKALRQAKIPTMTYHLDLWMGLERQKDMRSDPYWQLDNFFTVDRIMADYLNQNTPIKGHYLPAAVFHDDAYIANDPANGSDIIFVGSRGYHPEWPYRERLIAWLERTYGDQFVQWGGGGKGTIRGHELNQLYADSKVVVGDSLCLGFDYPDYWSDRIYETTGRGGFIIHPYIRGLEREFQEDIHVGFYKYGDFDDLQDNIDRFLADPEDREQIRLAGHQHTKDNFTYKHRWTKILETLELS